MKAQIQISKLASTLFAAFTLLTIVPQTAFTAEEDDDDDKIKTVYTYDDVGIAGNWKKILAYEVLSETKKAKLNFKKDGLKWLKISSSNYYGKVDEKEKVIEVHYTLRHNESEKVNELLKLGDEKGKLTTEIRVSELKKPIEIKEPKNPVKDDGSYLFKIPNDDTDEHRMIIFDPAPNTFTNTAPIIPYGIPEEGAPEYILFGVDAKYEYNTSDIDCYKYVPEDKKCRVYLFFEKGSSKKIKVTFKQGSLEKTETISTKKGFIKVFDIDNLVVDTTAYLEIKYENTQETEDTHYKIAIINPEEIKETKDWSGNGLTVKFNDEDTKKYKYYEYKNIDSEMCLEMSSESDDGIITAFLDGQLNNLDNNQSLELKDKAESAEYPKRKRYHFKGQEAGSPFIFGLKPAKKGNAYIKLSRVKPLVMVHGIDACPRWTGGPSSFGNLKDSPQSFELRPYRSFDFPWDSMYDVNKKYIGTGSETLGSFIKNSKTKNGLTLKATVVGHSAGCLITYHQCMKNTTGFKENVDNILLAAPPMFGSSLANMDMLIFKLVSPVLKRTNLKTFKMIQRGSATNWKRGTEEFPMSKKVSVIAGTKMRISLVDASKSSLDSWLDYHLYEAPVSPLLLLSGKIDENFSREGWKSISALWDTFVDPVENGLEWSIGDAIISRNSELNGNNCSDSAVGIYSAHLDKNKKAFPGTTCTEVDKIHSQVQLFNKNNQTFIDKVSERLSVIGD